ncbi:MAG: tandem-95 repeat protein, partial [Pirellulaceae bacterium]|nr:tandem-95 repeat protein [Pirellulaceae bacterium]
GTALFVDTNTGNFNLSAGNPNFYPAPASVLIDAGVESQDDRTNLIAVKDSVGIPESTILVTEVDLAGQIRRDGSTSSGQGQNVNIDIGALDRSDTTGPQAVIIVPIDDDAAGVDIDEGDTFLHLTSGTYNFFEILITEGSGIGPNESTITTEQLTILENGRELTPNRDVVIGYSASSRTLRFRSLSGLWRNDAVYEIIMQNQSVTLGNGTVVRGIEDLAGNSLQPNRADGQTRFTIVMPGVELDFGDAPASYDTLYLPPNVDDGARHAIIDFGNPRLGQYVDGEPDSAGVGTDDAPAAVAVDGNVQDAGSGPFTITTVSATQSTVQLTSAPAVGDNLRISAAGRIITYELVLTGGSVSVGRVAVPYNAGDSLTDIVTALNAAMQTTLPAQNVQVHVSQSGDTLTLTGADDEDGALIGDVTIGATTITGAFLNPADPTMILSYLNPLAPSGAELVLTTVGGGLLDLWIDFDGDGSFLQPGDRVYTSLPVVNGENRLQILTPMSPGVLSAPGGPGTSGTTWARFRLSATGSPSHDGLVVGGEVEDYEVFVAAAALPEPDDDSYGVLDGLFEDDGIALADGLNVGDNDTTNSANNLMFVLESDVSNGALTLNPDGTFSYDPNDDFYGTDSFTYRMTGTQMVDVGGTTVDLPVRSSRAGTVTLTVDARNDAPVATDKSRVTTEPSDTNTMTSVTLTAAELLDMAVPHPDLALATPVLSAPYNEIEQQLKVVQISVIDSTGTKVPVVPLDVTTPDPFLPTDGTFSGDTYLSDNAGGFVKTGTVTVTVLNNAVTQVTYQGEPDYNLRNPEAAANAASEDKFFYTIADDGATTLANGNAATPQPGPEYDEATVTITVQPQNDPPTATDDTIDSSTVNPLLMVPVLEDMDFVIPQAFLTENDFAGPSNDDDESLARGVSPDEHDGTVSVVTTQGTVDQTLIGPVNSGVAVDDLATGSGYIMFSEESVFSRFVAAPPLQIAGAVNSQHLVAVRYNGIDWEYNNDTAWVTFTPTLNDRLLASVNFDFDTITSLRYAVGTVDGIEQGFVNSDLTFEANRYGTLEDIGEFKIDGTFFEVSNDPDFPDGFRAFPLTTSQGGTVTLGPGPDFDLIYRAAEDYYGPDSFEYWIVDEGINIAADGTVTSQPKYDSATVTLTVDPVNDDPSAQNQDFVTLEDTALTITAAQLKAGSEGHANPALGFPFDESNQDDPNTNIVALDLDGTTVTAANAAAVPFNTTYGTVTAVNFDLSGNLIDLVYLPDQDFNMDNPRTAGARTLDSFGFTLADNGVAVLPQGGAGALGTTTLPLQLNDVNGLPWELNIGGVVGTIFTAPGPNDAFEFGFLNGDLNTGDFFFPPQGTAPTEENGREVVLGPAAQGLLQLERKVFVPDDGGYARFLEIYTNTGSLAVTQTVTIQSDLASDTTTTVIDTSSGDQTVALNDTWIVTDDGSPAGDPAVGHVIDGPGGIAPTSFTLLNNDEVNVTYDLTVNPGETQILMSFGIQNLDSAVAATQAAALQTPDAIALRGMTPTELAQVVNFSLPVPPQMTVMTPVKTTTAIARISVTPQNDAPVLGDDLIVAGDATWISFSSQDPVEDTTLVIPKEFLLDNDANARAGANDELGLINDTDTLTIVPMTFTTDLGGTVTLLQNGDLSYRAPDDRFGIDTFVYSVEDQGINEDTANVRTTAGLQASATVTILTAPVNDPPQTFDRAGGVFTGTEDTDLTFTAADLLGTAPGATDPATKVDSSPLPPAPFDENQQALRVVAFSDGDESIDVNDLPAPGTGALVLNTVSGGTITFNFANGAFVDGTYDPGDDYNQRTPFAAVELFNYIIADDGMTTVPGSGIVDGTGTDTTLDLSDQRSQSASVELRLVAVNDEPSFDFMSSVEILERDDNLATVIGAWASNILPGPDTALDEIQRESVVFTYNAALSSVSNPNLFSQNPSVSSSGALSVFTNPDEIGTATIVIDYEDFDNLTAGFVPVGDSVTFTLTVQPVNDAPRLISPLPGGASNPADPTDDAYAIAANGEITYTLKEDNTGAGGVATPYRINLRATGGGGYEPIGLLDLFEVGPANEVSATEPGGSQTLSLANFPAQTDLGGSLVVVTDGGGIPIALDYTPPVDYNNDIGIADSFNYLITDGNATGETYSLFTGQLEPDPLTVTNKVLLNLTPVNDAPVFELSTDQVQVAEDAALQTRAGFAFNFAAGPIATATDETDFFTGQSFAFDLSPNNFPAGDLATLFDAPPAISNGGVLTFEAADDVFGQFVFDVTVMDLDADNLPRGDVNVSAIQTLTIDVRPVNDPPQINPAAVGTLDFVTREDMPLQISASGGTVAGDLLGAFDPGPANESANITPGGNQTVQLSTVPTMTDQGGTLTPIFDSGNQLTHYEYAPAPNFVGSDSFVYQVIDDGETVLVGSTGQPIADPKPTDVTVTIDVQAVNNAPVFTGADDVVVMEDDGVVTIDDWATDVLPGPLTATDELTGPNAQTLTVVDLVPVAGNPSPSIFAVEPFLTRIGNSLRLSFETAQDASGVAEFDLVLTDDGPNSPANGDVNTTIKRFQIVIGVDNDPPTFTAGPAIQVNEDEDVGNGAGVFAFPAWATNISPGPGDEATTQSVTAFELTVPTGSTSLFAVAPAIDPVTGDLTFTTATDAFGTVDIEVVAVDNLSGRTDPPVTLTIDIAAVDDSPVPANDFINTDEDKILRIRRVDLLANDTDPDLPNDTLSVVIIPPVPSLLGATITIDPATGDLVYDPTTSALLQAMSPANSLEDRFTYSVEDADGENPRPTAEVILTVQGINDEPRVVDDQASVVPGGTINIDVLANDVDVDGTINRQSIIITLQPTNGALKIEPDGTLTYTADDGFTGSDTFRYTVADELNQQSEQATVTIGVSDLPQANPDVGGGVVGDPTVDIDVLANDTGDLNIASLQIETQPQNGTVQILAGGILRYTPTAPFNGEDVFGYSIEDTSGRRSAEGQITVRFVLSGRQNPVEFGDVDGNGVLTPADIIAVINKLANDGAGFTNGIPVAPGDRGPDFWDADGSGFVTPADILVVITALLEQSFNQGNEQIGPQGELIQSDVIEIGSDLNRNGSRFEPVSSIQDNTDHVVTASVMSAEVDPTIIDSIVDDEESDEDTTAAVDAVLSDLF